MKYQLSVHGWPIGDRLIPLGTVIDLPAKSGDDWSRLVEGRPMPLNAQALDAEAWDALVATYPEQLFRLQPKGF
jgi:hypothetical protein